MKYLCLVVLLVSCHNAKKSVSVNVNTSGENLAHFFDTSTRTWFVEYTNDSSIMILTDSATKVEVQIPLK